MDDFYYQLNPKGRSYETLKELSDSEVITLALLRSSLEVLSPSVLSWARLAASSLTCSPQAWGSSSLLVTSEGTRKLRGFFEPLRRAASHLGRALVGEPYRRALKTLIVDSLRCLRFCIPSGEVSQSLLRVGGLEEFFGRSGMD